jgi:ubiquinone/menaquinone biosynthesis C-methylase UbiE
MFGVKQLHAFDLDNQAVRFSKQNLNQQKDRCQLWVGSVNAIPVNDNFYDAVFNFGALHHVVNWRKSIREIYRVLKPGGRLYLEEILAKYIVHPLVRNVLYHPQEDRFDLPVLQKSLIEQGFKIIDTDSLLDIYTWIIADKPG